MMKLSLGNAKFFKSLSVGSKNVSNFISVHRAPLRLFWFENTIVQDELTLTHIPAHGLSWTVVSPTAMGLTCCSADVDRHCRRVSNGDVPVRLLILKIGIVSDGSVSM